MVVAPAPISLLLFRFEFGEVDVLAMVFFGPDTIGPVLMIIPLMFVVVSIVVVAAFFVMLVVRMQSNWHGGKGDGNS